MQPVFRGKHFYLDVKYFFVKATMFKEKVFDKIPLKLWKQQIVDNGQHMTDCEWSEQLILSTNDPSPPGSGGDQFEPLCITTY